LIIALAFLGINLEQSTLPNQEIVVQFNADSISFNEAQDAIASIKGQLKSIGVDAVQVSGIHNGKLKVTYYSTIDVAIVKGLFNNQEGLVLGDTAFNEKSGSSKIPFGGDSNVYKLDVSKIQKDQDCDYGAHGLVVEIRTAKDQYLNPIVPLGSPEVDFKLKYNIECVAFKICRNVALLIDNTTHKTPEVRAGPLS
jgi:hypothetical protein